MALSDAFGDKHALGEYFAFPFLFFLFFYLHVRYLSKKIWKSKQDSFG